MRPNKSPFIIVFIALVFCLVFPEPGFAGGFYYLPIYILAVILQTMSLLYKPSSADFILEPNEAADDPIKEIERIEEIDQTIKFSRSFCLAGGLISLYFLGGAFTLENVEYFLPIYLAILLHLTVFVIYLSFKHVYGEIFGRHSIFQIGLITGITLVGISLTFQKVTWSDGWPSRTISGGESLVDWNFVTLMVLLYIWSCFIIFWIVGLFKVSRSGRRSRLIEHSGGERAAPKRPPDAAEGRDLVGEIADIRAEAERLRRDISRLEGDVAVLRSGLDVTSRLAAVRRQIETLSDEVAELGDRRVSD